MRIYLVCRGQRTTISVEDQLLDYLDRHLSRGKDGRARVDEHPDPGLKAVNRHAERKQKTTLVRHWIQDVVDAAGDLLPDRGISQWVQARIVDVIANPALKDDATRARDAELAARVQALGDLRTAKWREHDAKRKAYEQKREQLEQLVQRSLGKAPRYRSPPRCSSL